MTPFLYGLTVGCLAGLVLGGLAVAYLCMVAEFGRRGGMVDLTGMERE